MPPARAPARGSRRSVPPPFRRKHCSRRRSPGDRSRRRAGGGARTYHTHVSYVRYRLTSSPPPAATGWDAWAEDYARLGSSNPTYALGKELLHRRVDEVSAAPRGGVAWVLDFHCGAGDDLARFLARGWDAWAEDYARLGSSNPTYALGKELLHR